MAYIYFNDGGITVEETYEDVSIEIHEAIRDKYPFIRLTKKEMLFDEKLVRMVETELEIQINISQIVWFR